MTFEEAQEWLENEHDGEFLIDDRAILGGLKILERYLDKDEDIIGAAEHDIIYLGGDVEEMTEEDILKLHRAGFHLDSDGECWAKFV